MVINKVCDNILPPRADAQLFTTPRCQRPRLHLKFEKVASCGNFIMIQPVVTEEASPLHPSSKQSWRIYRNLYAKVTPTDHTAPEERGGHFGSGDSCLKITCATTFWLCPHKELCAAKRLPKQPQSKSKHLFKAGASNTISGSFRDMKSFFFWNPLEETKCHVSGLYRLALSSCPSSSQHSPQDSTSQGPTGVQWPGPSHPGRKCGSKFTLPKESWDVHPSRRRSPCFLF